MAEFKNQNDKICTTSKRICQRSSASRGFGQVIECIHPEVQKHNTATQVFSTPGKFSANLCHMTQVFDIKADKIKMPLYVDMFM